MTANLYSPRIAALVGQMPLAPLGPGLPVVGVRPQLEVDTEALFAPLEVVDRSMARACHAGLWLAFNFFDESHAISQDLETVEGSYWHGILHRREPDAVNAKYWFRRVGEHPIFETLVKEAQGLGFRLGSAGWKPFDFIELCEKGRGAGSEQEMLLRRVQQREWELLFAYCQARSVGP